MQFAKSKQNIASRILYGEQYFAPDDKEMRRWCGLFETLAI